MTTQNQSVYTRRFNKLKKDLKKLYLKEIESGDVFFDDTAVLRWGLEQCIVAHDGSLGFSIWFTDENSEFKQCVSIVKTRAVYSGGLVGIHVQDTDLNHMVSMIQQALKDNFECIYIESLAS
jgi:hypothetical protein